LVIILKGSLFYILIHLVRPFVRPSIFYLSLTSFDSWSFFVWYPLSSSFSQFFFLSVRSFFFSNVISLSLAVIKWGKGEPGQAPSEEGARARKDRARKNRTRGANTGEGAMGEEGPVGGEARRVHYAPGSH